LLRGIFDKETRRKTVAVAGAAMEPGSDLAFMNWAEKLEDLVRIRRESR
jgi:hypothetical protein